MAAMIGACGRRVKAATAGRPWIAAAQALISAALDREPGAGKVF